ncbi:MAG TPA: chorismate-binding protein [Thermoanaerobaculia bacterium]|nr:chorismate-binding protein [Thermoanaerobaculia bacterium]
MAPTALFRDPHGGGWIELVEPAGALEAWSLADVGPALLEVDRWIERGAWTAGFVAYEAAPAFDRAMTVRLAEGPLCWWGLFRGARRRGDGPLGDDRPWRLPTWTPALGREAYLRRAREVRERIAGGDVYQVNLTFPLQARGALAGRTPLAGLAEHLRRTQAGAHGALLATGPLADGTALEAASGSPELFLALDGERLVSRPMKGTAAREAPERDAAIAAALAYSEKERAENLMIVDMMRNDLGRVARAGSVAVERLFEIEEYPTVYQMTSTVSARTAAPLREILAATFPPASVTGAPKIAAMRAITELEVAPRGLYCGALGFAGPGRRASLAVAIRTAFRRAPGEPVVFGVGSGVVADSSPAAEHAECRAKGAVVAGRPRRLLETLRLTRRGRYRLLERHLERLAVSAAELGYRFDRGLLVRRLQALRVAAPGSRVVQVLLAAHGALALEHRSVAARTRRVRVAFDDRPVDSGDPALRHKSDRRTLYRDALRRARARVGVCDDVLLWNREGELTESTVANVAVRIDGRWWTPPLESGLLPGTLRAELLARGRLEEHRLPIEEVVAAERVVWFNSVRGVRAADLIERSLPLALGSTASHGA